MTFVNTYSRLSEGFFERNEPHPVAAPRLIAWNDTLANELGFDELEPEARADYFGGNRRLPGSDPIALAYAGHQFGHFVPSLGDGRAHLLGEVVDREGRRRDIQLKGSGPTRFSRGGDGRSALGPALREYLMSEALHALGVPTTRSLCVVATGQPVFRETPQPGGIVTRVAASHLRVGTFQYFAAQRDYRAVQTLGEYAIERHFPDVPNTSDRWVAFLDRVIEEQIRTVVHWMRIGFIHGVMNTDNTTISGQTIDYGPCAMMNAYDPRAVFSSIDRNGRYAYGNQPRILAWNMVRLAECFLPLIDDDEARAIDSVKPMLEAVPSRFDAAWMTMMGAKLGLQPLRASDAELVEQLLAAMHTGTLDYTTTFDGLGDMLERGEASSALSEQLGPWLDRWLARIGGDQASRDAAIQLMRGHNPSVIPRNHHVESVLARCIETLDGGPAEAFLDVLRTPYIRRPETEAFTDPPSDGDRNYRTFCGT